MKKLLFIILTLAAVSYGDTLTYKNVTGNDTTTTIFILEQLKNGKKARVELNKRSGSSASEVIMTDSFSSRNWKYQCSRDKSDIEGKLNKDSVVVKGFFKNKSVNKSFPKNDLDWKQMFPYDLQGFVQSDSAVTYLCGVSIIELANMQLGTLEVKKVGMEKVMIHGKLLDLLHVRVSPPGFMSVFWHGDYWYKKNSGILVKATSIDSPGSPPVVSVLEM